MPAASAKRRFWHSARNIWAGGNTGIPQADPSDEFLDVIVLEPDSLLHLMAFWALMMLPGGRPLTLPRVRSVRLTRALVESEAAYEVEAHVNGEGVAWTPVIALKASIKW